VIGLLGLCCDDVGSLSFQNLIVISSLESLRRYSLARSIASSGYEKLYLACIIAYCTYSPSAV
jgi:hypothetical protein